jgi:hypothetical protein
MIEKKIIINLEVRMDGSSGRKFSGFCADVLTNSKSLYMILAVKGSETDGDSL